MNYDITFCDNKKCNKKCECNLKNVNEREVIIRCGISVRSFPECEYYPHKRKDKNND